MKPRKTIFKMFMAWQDEQEEQWLEEMSAQGWHLTRLKGTGSYEFEEGEPGKYTYRLDYHIVGKNDREDYLNLFADAGWEYLGEMASWQYFCKRDQPGAAEEIFTDMNSKIAKYKRFLRTQVMMLALYFTLWITLSRDSGHWFDVVLPIIFALLLLLLGINYFKTAQRIKELEQTGLPVEKDALG